MELLGGIPDGVDIKMELQSDTLMSMELQSKGGKAGREQRTERTVRVERDRGGGTAGGRQPDVRGRRVVGARPRGACRVPPVCNANAMRRGRARARGVCAQGLMQKRGEKG
eukprot:7085236-Prymnesium_polylepis.1